MMTALRYVAGLAVVWFMTQTPVAYAVPDVEGGDHAAEGAHGDDHAVGGDHGDDHATGDDHAAGGDHGDDHAAGGDHGDDHAAGGDHGEGHGDGHGDDAHGGGHHGPAFTGDNDGDGTANWMDPDDEHYVVTAIGWHVLNFLIYLGVIYWAARQPIADALRTRALGIKQDLAEASRLKEEADAQFATLEERLANFESEVSGMMAKAEADAKAEHDAIIARGESEAARIATSAQQQIRDEAARARQAIRAEAVDAAVKLAEGILTSSINPTDQRKLAVEFLSSVQEDGRV